MSNLRTRVGAALLSMGLLTLPACAETGGDLNEEEFRHFPVPPDLQQPDTGIYDPEDDCLIWDISNGTGYSPSGEVVLDIIDGVFYDPDGVAVCVMDGNELSEFRTVRSTANPDDVVFTVRGPFIFEGSLDLEGKNKWQRILEMRSKLLFTFFFEHVFEGPVWHNNIVVTADTNIMIQTRQRKLQIASLITGECGGPGLPDPHPPGGG